MQRVRPIQKKVRAPAVAKVVARSLAESRLPYYFLRLEARRPVVKHDYVTLIHPWVLPIHLADVFITVRFRS